MPRLGQMGMPSEEEKDMQKNGVLETCLVQDTSAHATY